MKIIPYQRKYISEAIRIWNDIVQQGQAFPQEEILDEKSGHNFFSEQTYTAVALIEDRVVGLYILHPNNVGRCGHICNASYAVDAQLRGQGIGKQLVLDCIQQACLHDFKILQFNAVVADNLPALQLYKELGFTQLGIIPKGFKNKEGVYKDIIPHYIEC